MGFDHIEDKEYFDTLLESLGGVTENGELFDFRDPKIKRDEFNKMRSKVFNDLVLKYGDNCQLQCHKDCGGSAEQVDHLIPLSSNILNKKIRELKGRDGKKVPSQSFGSNNIANFVLACKRCNAFKKHRFPDSQVVNNIRVIRQIKT